MASERLLALTLALLFTLTDALAAPRRPLLGLPLEGSELLQALEGEARGSHKP